VVSGFNHPLSYMSYLLEREFYLCADQFFAPSFTPQPSPYQQVHLHSTLYIQRPPPPHTQAQNKMFLYTYKKSRRVGHLKSRPFSRLASARALTNLIDVIKRVKVVKGGVCWGGSSFSTLRGSLSLCGRVWWSNRPHYLNPHTL
jgi:hypothetical protein